MSYACQLCQKDYSSLKRLENHKCSFCFYCQRSYSTKQKYDSHNCDGKRFNAKLNTENLNNSNHVCQLCKKGFSSINYLAAHKCPYCAKCDHIFASYQKYEMHKRKCDRVHVKADEVIEEVPPAEPPSTPVVTDYKCELCKKYFSSPKYLATHKCAYCEPCRRSFATFQKFRLHRQKCSKAFPLDNTLDENIPESSTSYDVTNENSNSLQDLVAARGNYITRTVISRMAMLELLRRRSGLSSINDLMQLQGIALSDETEAFDQPEDLSCPQNKKVSSVENSHENALHCGDTTTLLSRLSMNVGSQENSKCSEDMLITCDEGIAKPLDERSGSSPDCSPKLSSEHFSYDQDSVESPVDCSSARLKCLTYSNRPGKPLYDSENSNDILYEKSPCDDDRADEKKHDQSLSNNDISGDYSPYSDTRTGKKSPKSDLDKTDILSLEFTDSIGKLSPFYVSELHKKAFGEHPSAVEGAPSLSMSESSEVAHVEQQNAVSVLHQNAVIVHLMQAVRSQILLSASSQIPSYHYMDGSEMPRAKLIDSKPRGRMSAYAFFVQTCREEHKKKHPDENVVFSEFSRKCADRWKTMTDKEKHRFYEMAEKDKDRYDNEMKGYRGPRTPRGSRKRRNRKDPNAPKRALSAFFWFSNDERPKIRAANPDMGVGDIAKQLGAAWSNTPPEVKAKYETMAETDKARYEREMKAFKEGNFGAKKLKTANAPNDEEEDDESESEEDEEEDDDDEAE